MKYVFKNWILGVLSKICIIEVYHLEYYLKATSYINDAIIEKQSSSNQILWYLNYVDIIGLCNSV